MLYDLTSADDHGGTDIGMVDSTERSCSLGWRDDAGGKTRVEHSRDKKKGKKILN